MTTTILRIPAAKTQSGYSRSTIYLRSTDQSKNRPPSMTAQVEVTDTHRAPKDRHCLPPSR